MHPFVGNNDNNNDDDDDDKIVIRMKKKTVIRMTLKQLSRVDTRERIGHVVDFK